MFQEDLYVVLTYDKTQERWQLCYQFNTPFVGTYDEAKVLLVELQEWMPEENYVIYKVVEA